MSSTRENKELVRVDAGEGALLSGKEFFWEGGKCWIFFQGFLGLFSLLEGVWLKGGGESEELDVWGGWLGSS